MLGFYLFVVLFILLTYIIPFFLPPPSHPICLNSDCVSAHDHYTVLNIRVLTKEKKENKLSSGLCSSIAKVFSKRDSTQI